ncbi:sushi, von Willebrand factor type A, EGF and pentraxin domain-containing protein 1 [Hydra vulgaris]|uniref:sushi, von Willebrand factor type A, EGF and pentraxin domain-containing protein 1 n=1 Tax=Hydra vulgaris TaxID=6087 RepID=UPI0002B483E7|nr:sushi, von Willebrand factor type A, EGF and pentraxin domain-containing protein 1 [Hydra vulgaris]
MFKFLACSLILTVIVEMKPLSQSAIINNFLTPDNWRSDKKYRFTWEGDFSYNVPKNLKCPRVIIPDHGRFVCSAGENFSRSMCLPECEIGYRLAMPESASVFICLNNGKWIDIFKNSVPTPVMKCVEDKYAF